MATQNHQNNRNTLTPSEYEKYYVHKDVDRSIQLLWLQDYTDSLLRHIQAVYQAGIKLEIDYEQLDFHDDSKWYVQEFPHYARHFHGDKGNPTGWARAWLHHIHKNPHHWQHWIFPDKFKVEGADIEEGVLEMPSNFALEMIADWMGSSFVYTGSWDMHDWLAKNSGRIILHSKTAKFVESVLRKEGYDVRFKTPHKEQSPVP